METQLCKEHSGLKEGISNLGKEIGGIRGLIMWAILIFLTLTMAVTGFLWSGQDKLWQRISSNHKEIIDQVKTSDAENDADRECIKEKINGLTRETTEIKTKVDHLYRLNGGKKSKE